MADLTAGTHRAGEADGDGRQAFRAQLVSQPPYADRESLSG
jgi:hypothetical protein